jgi:hypothetical protein
MGQLESLTIATVEEPNEFHIVFPHDSKDVLFELFFSRALGEELLTGKGKATSLVPRIFHALYSVVAWVRLALKHLNFPPEDALPMLSNTARTGLQEASGMMSLHENNAHCIVSLRVCH